MTEKPSANRSAGVAVPSAKRVAATPGNLVVCNGHDGPATLGETTKTRSRRPKTGNNRLSKRQLTEGRLV